MEDDFIDKLWEFLTRPRGKVGRIRSQRLDQESRIQKLDQTITLNGDQTWFRQTCNKRGFE